METTEKGECFLFVNNDVQNVSLKMIPTLIEEQHQKVFGFVHSIKLTLRLERVQNESFECFRQLKHKQDKSNSMLLRVLKKTLGTIADFIANFCCHFVIFLRHRFVQFLMEFF